MLKLELLEAVDRLTRPARRKIMQDRVRRVVSVIDGVEVVRLLPDGQEARWIEDEAPLKRLQDAIASDIGGSSRGASLASQRSVLDADALYQAIQITTLVADWCRVRGVPVTRDAIADLRAWYVSVAAAPPEDTVMRWWISKLRSWASTIDGLLDRPHEMDLPDECPVCGAQSWFDQATGAEYRRPLVIKYRPGDDDLTQQARGLCRACGQVFGVRELAWELEHRHAAGEVVANDSD